MHYDVSNIRIVRGWFGNQ